MIVKKVMTCDVCGDDFMKFSGRYIMWFGGKKTEYGFAAKVRDHLLSFKWNFSGRSGMWFCGESPGSFVDQQPVRATLEKLASHQRLKHHLRKHFWKNRQNENPMNVTFSKGAGSVSIPPGATFVEAGPKELEGDRHRHLLHRCNPLHCCPQVEPTPQSLKMYFQHFIAFFHSMGGFYPC